MNEPIQGDYIAYVTNFGITIAFDTRITRCENCKYWSGMCCTAFGKMEHPRRSAFDYCSRGERKEEE